jgi:hypothetical protein
LRGESSILPGFLTNCDILTMASGEKNEKKREEEEGNGT